MEASPAYPVPQTDSCIAIATNNSLPTKCPPEPASKRIALWRRLKGMGAIYLQNGVCLLPKTDDRKREFPRTLTPSFQRRSLSDGRVRADQAAAFLAKLKGSRSSISVSTAR